MSTIDLFRSIREKLCEVQQEFFDLVQKEVARSKEEGQEAFEESTAEEFVRRLEVIAQQYCEIEPSVESFFRCSGSELSWRAYVDAHLRYFGLWYALLNVEVEGSLLLDNLTSALCGISEKTEKEGSGSGAEKAEESEEEGSEESEEAEDFSSEEEGRG